MYTDEVFERLVSQCIYLFALLPNPRDPSVTTRLRSANKFPRLPSCTRKYQTFISYALSLSINLHNYPNIYLSILFLFRQFSMIIFVVYCIVIHLDCILACAWCAIWSYDHQVE